MVEFFQEIFNSPGLGYVLDAHIRNEASIISYIITCFSVLIVFCLKSKIRNYTQYILLIFEIEYLFKVVASTILFRTPDVHVRYELVPFTSYFVGGPLQNELYIDNFCNVCLFIPLGVFILLNNYQATLKHAIIIGTVLSLLIEFTQFVTKLGLFEVDDIIHNSLGCLIGFYFGKLAVTIYKRYSQDKHLPQ